MISNYSLIKIYESNNIYLSFKKIFVIKNLFTPKKLKTLKLFLI